MVNIKPLEANLSLAHLAAVPCPFPNQPTMETAEARGISSAIVSATETWIQSPGNRTRNHIAPSPVRSEAQPPLARGSPALRCPRGPLPFPCCGRILQSELAAVAQLGLTNPLSVLLRHLISHWNLLTFHYMIA